MGELKEKLLSGILYTGLAKYVGLFVSLGITAILARILSPSDFGIIAIATVFINFFSTLTTVGISPAIVQNKKIGEKDIESIYTFTLIIAAILTGLYILVIPLIAIYYKSDVLESILYCLSANIFFSVIAIVPNALLMKDKRFKFIAARTFFIQVFFGIISVIAAYYGMGIYALTLNPIGSSIFLFCISYKAYPIRLGKITSVSISKIFVFSLFQMLYNFVYLGYRNIDKILIGKYFSISSLGYYEKSYRLMMLPLENISTVISPVLHPLLSDYQNDPQYLWNTYKKIISFLSEFSFLLSVLLYYLSEIIIIGIYGDKWVDAIPIFRILSLSVCFQLLQSPIGAILQAANAVKKLFYSSLWIFFAMIIGLIIGIYYKNFYLVPYMVDLVFFVGFMVYQIYVVRLFKQSVWQIFALIAPHIGYSIILFVILYIISCVGFNNIWWNGGFMIFASFAFCIILYVTNQIPNVKKIMLDMMKNITKSKI